MRRYIEIVYDNSSSMNEVIGRKAKYEIAQELFESEILPTIALKGDEVILRLLRGNCNAIDSPSESLTRNFGSDRRAMLDRIKRIQHNQNTPLFQTVSDSVEACRKVMADEYLIFVLTDGDDTCGVQIEDLLDEETLRKYVKLFRVLLVQMAVHSVVSRNNLTALASRLGGQTVILDGHDQIPEMKGKLRKALTVSGFSTKLPLDHCFDSMPGFDLSWDEINNSGIDMHQATLLFNKGMLSWEPNPGKKVTALQFAELRFIFGIVFMTGIPDQLALTMLSQLKKPYYYSHDCIYWDFSSARWRYFKTQNATFQVENPHARFEDSRLEGHGHHWRDTHHQIFDRHNVYRVESAGTVMPAYKLVPMGMYDWNIELKPGDQVRFVDR